MRHRFVSRLFIWAHLSVPTWHLLRTHAVVPVLKSTSPSHQFSTPFSAFILPNNFFACCFLSHLVHLPYLEARFMRGRCLFCSWCLWFAWSSPSQASPYSRFHFHFFSIQRIRNKLMNFNCGPGAALLFCRLKVAWMKFGPSPAATITPIGSTRLNPRIWLLWLLAFFLFE